MISTTITNESTHSINNHYIGYQVGSDDATTNRTGTTDDYKQTYFVYMGMAGIPSKNALVNFSLDTTAITGQSWAEIGIFRGNFALGGTASLVRLGVTDVQDQLSYVSINTLQGSKNIPISLNPSVRPGDNLWIGYGISASTMPILHSSPHVNPAFPGTIQTVSPSTRPSQLTGPFGTTGLTNSGFRPVVFKLTIY